MDGLTGGLIVGLLFTILLFLVTHKNEFKQHEPYLCCCKKHVDK